MPTSIKTFKCADGLRVKGDGVHDDTTGIQKAFSAAQGPGDLLIPWGRYLITSRVVWDARVSRGIRGEGGPEFVFAPKDDSTACLEIIGTTPDDATKVIEGLRFRGPSKTDPTTDHSYKIGKYVGLRIANTHNGALSNLTFTGFDGAGLDMTMAHYWAINSVTALHNGYGVRCDVANACNFYRLRCDYNLYGCENVQSIIGGSVEGNARSGIRCLAPHVRYSFHDVWLEANNLADVVPGEADIWAGDPDANPWEPRVISLSGNTSFHGLYGDRAVATHQIAGHVMLMMSSAMRIFPNKHGAFNLREGSSVTDATSGNSFEDGTRPNKLTEYRRADARTLDPSW